MRSGWRMLRDSVLSSPTSAPTRTASIRPNRCAENWDQFIWDYIHLRPHSFETFSFETFSFEIFSFETFIWDFFIRDHIDLRPHSFETTFIWDHIHFRSHSFYATYWSCLDLLRLTFLWFAFHFFSWGLKFCKVTLHSTFCKITPFPVQGNSRWVVNALAL